MKKERKVEIRKISIRGIALLMLASGINVVSIPMQEKYIYRTEAATKFSDDSEIREYSRSAVESLLARGGIKGYPEDNTFRPQGTITKLEFLSMVVNSLDPDGTKLAEGVQQAKDEIVYDDVSTYAMYKNDGLVTELWGGKAFDLIIGARQLGIGSSYESNATDSGWDTPITREDAAMMIVQGLKALKNEDLEAVYNLRCNSNDFDWDKLYENKERIAKLIGDWSELTESDVPDEPLRISVSGSGHSTAIQCLYASGIAQGDSESKFYPKKYLTREDSAILIEKAVNTDKRTKVTLPEADKKVDSTEGIENTTLKQTDPNRRGAIEGDTFIKADGTEIKVVKDEKSGVIGANQPVALDMGRNLVFRSNTGKYIEHKIVNYGEKKLTDGSISVNLGYIENDKITADENTYSGKGDYIYNPKTGEGHSKRDWGKMAESFKPTDKGTEGEIRHFGLGDWCEYKYTSTGGWDTVSGTDIENIVSAYR